MVAHFVRDEGGNVVTITVLNIFSHFLVIMAGPKHPNNNNGIIRIRFTYKGISYVIGNLGRIDDEIAYKYAQNICDRIRRDISIGNFTANNNGELILKYHPAGISRTLTKNNIDNFDDETIDIKTKTIKELKNKNGELEKYLAKHLINYPNTLNTKKEIEQFIEWLKKEKKLASSSVDRYFDILRVIDDVFREVKIVVEQKPNEQPFTKDEINLILNWFEKDITYSRYYNYVLFLFLTGCRTSEAIGLKWSNIDMTQKLIYFCETLARDVKGSSGNRIKKTTKKNIMRTFPMNDKLYNFMLNLYNNKKSDLVFLVNGHCIDDRHFRSRPWTKCLRKCNIKYRRPYNTRHTFISHFLEQTKDVVKCAALTHGSKSGIATIYKHYASIINKIEVPDLF